MDFFIRVEVGTFPFYISVTQDEFNAFIETVREHYYIETSEKPCEYNDGFYVTYYSICDGGKNNLGFVYKN